MKKIEIDSRQLVICESLSKQAKDRCNILGIKAVKCEPKHFLLLVFRYGERITKLGRLMDDCLIWCQCKGLRQFTPARFANWCKIELSKYEQRQARFKELDQLRNGNQYQRAEFARRTSHDITPHHNSKRTVEPKEDTEGLKDEYKGEF